MRSVKDRASLLGFLRDQLDWPITAEKSLAQTTMRLSGDASAQAQVARIVAVVPEARFAVALVEFQAPLRRSDLRTTLIRIRGEAVRRTAVSDSEAILFVCATEGYDHVFFARLITPDGSVPELRVFGWERGQAEGLRPLLEYHLPALKALAMAEACWDAAWDLEKINRDFLRECRVAFDRMQQHAANSAVSLSEQDSAGIDAATRREQKLMLLRGFLCRLLTRLLAPDVHAHIRELLPDLLASRPFPCDQILDALFRRWTFTLYESAPHDMEVAIGPEMPGTIFEELIVGRHASGSYYTPRSIVAFMCREALKHYLTIMGAQATAAEALVDRHDTTAFRAEECAAVLTALQQVRVMDPACGSGAYLLGMLHELAELRKLLPVSHQSEICGYERTRDIIQHNLHGVDLDGFAVNIARLRLWLALLAEQDSAAAQPLPDLRHTIRQGDSLDLARPSSVFDIVLANPPYLSTKHGFGQANRAALQQTFQTARGQFDAYALFLERAFTLLNSNGCYAYIVPRPALTNSNMRPLRQLLQDRNIIAIADPGNVFAAAVEPIILIGSNIESSGNVNADINIYLPAYFQNSRTAVDCVRREDIISPSGTWNIAPTAAARRLVARLSDLPTFGDLFEITRGIECGKKNATILQQAQPEAAPLLRGADMNRFRIDFAGLYIVPGADRRTYKPERLYEAPKLLIRRVAPHIVAAIDLHGYHVLNTIYVARARPGNALALEYVCALLNSQLINDYFHAVFGNEDRLFPYLRKAQIAQLPIPLPAPEQEERIVSLVRRLQTADASRRTPLQVEIDRQIQGLCHL